MKIISIVNQKGGVAKTTTTNALGIALGSMGYTVLLIDLDPQGNLSMSLGVNFPDEQPFSISQLMLDIVDKKDINTTPFVKNKFGVDFFIGNSKLSMLDKMLPNIRGGEFILDEVLSKLNKKYDYVIIDCMPSVGLLTENALCCSDEAIITTEPQFFSMKGVQSLISEILTIKRRYNPKLVIDGILPTKVNIRTNNTKEFIKMLYEVFSKDLHIYDFIPLSVKISEASKGKNIYNDGKRCKGAIAYLNFVLEYIKRGV